MMYPALEGRANTPAAYRMIEELSIRNFRCFQSLKLEKLRRINLVVGRNAAGKTALLEAIRMAVGGLPQTAAWLNAARGLQATMIQPIMTREQFESMWEPFFFKLEKERRITFERQDSNHLSTTLEIFFDASQAVVQIPQVPQPNGGEATAAQRGAEAAAVQRISPASAVLPLVFRRNGPNVSGDLKATLLPGGQFHLEPGQELGPASAVLGATIGYQPADNTAWFTRFVTENRESEILELVQREYPDVKGLAVVPNPFGGSVWVSLPYLQNKLPMSLLSAGISKFFTLILAVHFYKHGVVLVDEIENGTYYDRLPSLWTALHRVSRENDCQLFATTHSQDCLRSALDIIREDEEQFSLIRLRQIDGEINAQQFAGRDVASAIEEGVEVR